MQLSTPWTAAKVAEALVRAFRRLPGKSVWGSGGRFVIDDVETIAAFAWPEQFVPKLSDRQYLLTWARCIATGDSVRERYLALGWKRATVERRRILALQSIATALNRDNGAQIRT